MAAAFLQHPPGCSITPAWTAPISASCSPSQVSPRTQLSRSRPGLGSAGPGHHVLGAGAIRTAFRRPRRAADADAPSLLYSIPQNQYNIPHPPTAAMLTADSPHSAVCTVYLSHINSC